MRKIARFTYYPTLFFLGFWGIKNVHARSLISSTKRLGDQTQDFALTIGFIGLVIVGILMVMGKQEAWQKFFQVIFGFAIILSVKGIVSFLSGSLA